MKDYEAILKKRLERFEKRAYRLMREGNYAWEDEAGTIKLLNDILKGIPDEFWPPSSEDNYLPIHQGNWILSLHWEPRPPEANVTPVRHANLSHATDDHTAWVQEDPQNKGSFIDFDIGGS